MVGTATATPSAPAAAEGAAATAAAAAGSGSGSAADAERAAEGSTTQELAGLRAALAAAEADAAARTEQLEQAKARAKALVRKQIDAARAEERRSAARADAQQRDIDRLAARVRELEAAAPAAPAPASAAGAGAGAGPPAAERIDALRRRLQAVVASAAPAPSGAGAGAAEDGETPRAPAPAAAAAGAPPPLAQEAPAIADELASVAAAVRALADDLRSAQTAAAMLQDDARAQAVALQRALAEARAEAQALRSRAAAAAAKEKAGGGASAIAQGAELKVAVEARAVLEAKVSSMDVLLTEKSAEVLKVREKAREFLKNMSADKKAMETRMKDEIASLKASVAALQDKIAAGESHAQTLDSELENCLALVSEKQKTIQMLSMARSTEREAAAAAAKEILVVKTEFARYKDRARAALEERDSRLGEVDTAVAAATKGLREELGVKLEALADAQSALKESEAKNKDAKVLMDRAVRAETALDLERSSADTESSVHAGRLNKLQQSVEAAEQHAAEQRARADEAEERFAAVSSRLQAATKAASAAMARAAAQEKSAASEAGELRAQIAALEASLHRSVESASAAQRVAAVAARALGSPSPNPAGQRSSTRGSPSPRASPFASGALPRLPTDDALSGIGSSSLAAVMSSHTLSAGLAEQGGTGANGEGDSVRAYRDQQMAVLVSQLSELSTLLDDAQEETRARAQQSDLLKQEVRELEGRLAAADKLHNGAPFGYLRTVVVRFLQTGDQRLLPVIAEVLSFSKEEMKAVKEGSGAKGGAQGPGLFSLPFLGRG